MLADVMRATRSARAEAQDGEPAGSNERMLDPALLARWRNEIRGRAQAVRGTTHLGVIDSRGNLASLTLSNGEGSGRVVPGTGVMLNNMLGEEDLNPGGFHRWPPAHRMASMMAPSALRWPDGRSSRPAPAARTASAAPCCKVIVNLVDHGMDVGGAVRAPRIHVEGPLLSVEGATTGTPSPRRWPRGPSTRCGTISACSSAARTRPSAAAARSAAPATRGGTAPSSRSDSGVSGPSARES